MGEREDEGTKTSEAGGGLCWCLREEGQSSDSVVPIRPLG